MASDFSTKVNTGINNFLSDVGTGFVSNITSGKSIFALPSFNDTSATPTTTPTPPVSTPNSVVSSNTTNPKTQNGKDIIANTDQAKTQKDALDATTQSTDQYMRGNTNIKNPNYVPTPPPPPPPPPVITPEDTAVGNQLFYNSITGKQEKIDTSQTPIPPKTVTSQSEGSNGVITKVYSDGSSDVFQSDGKTLISSNPATQTISTPPTGYQTTDPQSGLIPAGDVNGMNNETYHTYQDGHYGVTDGNGNYHSVTSDTYNTAKTANAANKSLTDAINGILTPEQQTRLNGLLATQQADMKTLLSTNTAITGSATVWGARNAQGVSSSAGDIQKTILDGADRVQKLQTEQAAAVDAMRQSFKHDDVEALNAALKAYDSGVKAINDSINSTTTKVQKQQEKDATNLENLKNRVMLSNGGVGIDPTALSNAKTAEEVDKVYQNSAGQVGKANNLPPIMTDAQINFLADAGMHGGSDLGKMANELVGMGSVPFRERIILRIADKAMAAGISAGDFVKGLASGHIAETAATIIGKQQAQTTVNENTAEKMMDTLVELSKNLDDNTFKTSIPLIDAKLRDINMAVTGDPKVVNLTNQIVETMTEYAKVMTGQTTGGAVTDAAIKAAKDLLSNGYSYDTIKSQINIAKGNMKNRLDSYQKEGQSLLSDIANANAISPDTSGSTINSSNSNATGQIETGDTFASIATKLGTTVDALQKLNPNMNAQNLKVGDIMNLPSSSSSRTAGSYH